MYDTGHGVKKYKVILTWGFYALRYFMGLHLKSWSSFVPGVQDNRYVMPSDSSGKGNLGICAAGLKDFGWNLKVEAVFNVRLTWHWFLVEMSGCVVIRNKTGVNSVPYLLMWTGQPFGIIGI